MSNENGKDREEQLTKRKGSRFYNETRREDRRAKKFLRLINRRAETSLVGIDERSKQSGIRDKEKNF